FPPTPSGIRAFVERQQTAWRLALDHNRLDAGGQAEDWLNRLAQTRRDYPEARQTAATLRRQRTFYREVLPALLVGEQNLPQWVFSPQRLRELFEPEWPVTVYNPTLEQLGDLFAAEHFAPVPASPTPTLYVLPDRSFESQLRIAAVASGRARTA